MTDTADCLAGAVADFSQVTDDALLTRAQAAFYLGVSVSCLEVWAGKGLGPRFALPTGARYPGYPMGGLRAFKKQYRRGGRGTARFAA